MLFIFQTLDMFDTDLNSVQKIPKILFSRTTWKFPKILTYHFMTFLPVFLMIAMRCVIELKMIINEVVLYLTFSTSILTLLCYLLMCIY
jgi:hypothetical protein